ncbi:hypothetical protein CTKA_00609 [Chthonomonas calidirosea]|nr:hypothetical protein CTKA_00609 [Chthonomonas calidirosea]
MLSLRGEHKGKRLAKNRGNKKQRAYKPGSVFVWPSLWGVGYPAPQAIYREGPRAASTPPFDLAPDGVCQAGVLPHRRCALTAPFHRYRSQTATAVCFLWHFPSGRPARMLSGIVPYGARTFLCSVHTQCSCSGHPALCILSILLFTTATRYDVPISTRGFVVLERV